MEGLEALRAKMQALPVEFGKRALRRAIRKAGNVLESRVRQAAATLDDPGTGRSISANVASRFSPRYEKQTGDLLVRVGIRQGAVLPKAGARPSVAVGGPTPHWRLLEFGTALAPARPFFRPAAEAAAPEVFDTFAAEADAALDRAINRLSKGVRK